jgi:hypothetical protein
MVINFRAREISQDTRNLTRIHVNNNNKKKKTIEVLVLKVKLDYDVSKMCPRNYNW